MEMEKISGRNRGDVEAAIATPRSDGKLGQAAMDKARET